MQLKYIYKWGMGLKATTTTTWEQINYKNCLKNNIYNTILNHNNKNFKRFKENEILFQGISKKNKFFFLLYSRTDINTVFRQTLLLRKSQ